MKRRWLMLAALAAALLFAGAGRAETAEDAVDVDALYIENGWSFVERSMDVSGGIPADARGVLAEIAETGVLRVATEPYFPPQEYIDPALTGQDSFVGSDMELARLVAKRMGVRLEIVPLDFADVFTAVMSGDCDLAISALSYTPGRAAQMTLSKGYNFAGTRAGSKLIIRAADSGRITGIDSLAGRNIAAQSGSLQEAQMYENVFHYREFRRLPLVQDVYDALMNGSVDAALVDAESGMAYIEGHPRCGLMMVPGVYFTQEPQFDGDRVAARKGETQLIGFVNGVIDEVLESGQYRAWYAEYSARYRELTR